MGTGTCIHLTINKDVLLMHLIQLNLNFQHNGIHQIKFLCSSQKFLEHGAGDMGS
jgi:hypothetical protein